ncbi:MAG TPA: efflux RND transporter periplasmic adaptor subunit [Panacibacter sp.]|nr:efflux RND transporter periplasmic adaptor subunit [Panacibacter sp.]
MLCCLAVCISCNSKDEKTTPALIPEVNVVTAGLKTIPVYTDYVGTTFGEADVEIKPKVDGTVMGIYFKEGEQVKKGQLLYSIDDAALRNKADQAKARVAQANTQMVKMKADLDRVRPLTEMHALSQRDLDAAIAGYGAAENEVEIAKAALKNAELDLGDAKITAPISGVIGISKAVIGDYVSRISTTGSLNTISSLGDMRVRFSISENEYLRFAKRRTDNSSNVLPANLPVQLILSDGTVYPEEGYVNIANRQIDAGTGSLLLQAGFKNSFHLLRPGQYVKVRFKTDTYDNAVLIPQQAVNQMQNIYIVMVLNDSNQLKPRTIKTGLRTGSNWIVTDGLKAGEKIAVVGNAIIKPGIVVKPAEMKWNYDSTSAQ